jgi:hypothetical protein
MVTTPRKSSRSSTRAQGKKKDDDDVTVTTKEEEEKEKETEITKEQAEPDKNDANEHEDTDTRMMESRNTADEAQPAVAVDQAFQELFGYSWGTAFYFDSHDCHSTGSKHSKHSTLARSQRLLVHMLGPTAAAQIWREMTTASDGTANNDHHSSTSTSGAVVQRATVNIKSNKPTVHRKQQHYKQAAAAVVPLPTRGAAATITATATNPQSQMNMTTASSTTTATSATAATGVDQLLDQIANGDGKVTVTTKTAADWENFKDTTGLQDKLQQAATGKQAYLQRQDFLQRVDHRKFDLEKQERNQERSKRGK